MADWIALEGFAINKRPERSLEGQGRRGGSRRDPTQRFERVEQRRVPKCPPGMGWNERPLFHAASSKAASPVSASSGHTTVVSWRAKKARCPAPDRSSPPSMLLASMATVVHGPRFYGCRKGTWCRRLARAACRVAWLCLTQTSRASPVPAAQQAATNQINVSRSPDSLHTPGLRMKSRSGFA